MGHRAPVRYSDNPRCAGDWRPLTHLGLFRVRGVSRAVAIIPRDLESWRAISVPIWRTRCTRVQLMHWRLIVRVIWRRYRRPGQRHIFSCRYGALRICGLAFVSIPALVAGLVMRAQASRSPGTRRAHLVTRGSVGLRSDLSGRVRTRLPFISYVGTTMPFIVQLIMLLTLLGGNFPGWPA